MLVLHATTNSWVGALSDRRTCAHSTARVLRDCHQGSLELPFLNSSQSPFSMPDHEDVAAAAAHQIALYCSHALAAWGQRMWEFAVGLILLNQFPSSFAAVAVAGVVMSLSQASCGALIGEFLDRYARYTTSSYHIATPNTVPRGCGAPR